MLIAHRGFRSKTGENRMVDFVQALKITPAVEFDIRLTKDRKVIIFHDDDFQRIGDSKKRVFDLTYQKIKNLPFFQNQHDWLPPLLIQDFGQKIAKKYQLINVEIKVDDYTDQDLKVIKKSLTELRKLTNAEIIVSSFGHQLLTWIADFNQDFKKGYLVEKMKDLDWDLIKKFDYLHPSLKIAKTKKSQKLFNQINLPLNIWTFKKNQDLKKIAVLKPLIKGYISDFSDLAVEHN